MGEATDFFVSYTSADRAGRSGLPGSWRPRATTSWSRRRTPSGPRLPAADAPGRPGGPADHRGALSGLPRLGLRGAEWRAVFAKDPTGERGLLLPVRVDQVEPPGLLKSSC